MPADPSPCPVCGHETEHLASLGSVPVHVGLLWRSPEAARACPVGDLDLVLCPVCGHVANAAFDPTLLDYTGDYDNALHHSPRFQRWEADLVGELARDLTAGSTVVEIGSGDARFLAEVCRRAGARGVGFEPGHNPARTSELAVGVELTIVADFADPDRVAAHRPDLVVTRHVLEHIPTPGRFLKGLAGVGDGVTFYVEVPDLDFALERRAVEDFMYEHCGYYTPATLAVAARRAGLEVRRAVSTFDGMFAAVTAISGLGGSADGTAAVTEDELARIRTGVQGVADRTVHLAGELARRREAGQRIAAWGGGARTVGLMNLVPEAVDAVDLVVDINPRKQGTYVAGTGQLIAAPATLREHRPDAVWVVNPTYRDEISGMLTDLGVRADVFSV